MITDINNEDRPVQQTFAAHLEKALGWESVYAYNSETLGPTGRSGARTSAMWRWLATCCCRA